MSFFKNLGSSEPTNAVLDVSLWNKTKGAVSGLFDTGTKDIGALYGDVDFEDPANDELLGVIADTEGEIAASKKDDGLPWADIFDAASKAWQWKEGSVREAPAFRAPFRPVQIPAGQYDTGAIANQLSAQSFANEFSGMANNQLSIPGMGRNSSLDDMLKGMK